ncbi:MAG: hypothetical protein ACFE9Q_10820 [Candidatus Hodarchaeota archaeon]
MSYFKNSCNVSRYSLIFTSAPSTASPSAVCIFTSRYSGQISSTHPTFSRVFPLNPQQAVLKFFQSFHVQSYGLSKSFS